MALGTCFSGLAASPAATPTISVPWKLKPATMKIARTPANPLTKGASPFVQLSNPGWVSPRMPAMMRTPRTRKTTTTTTLTRANQNSPSP
jgi:hypothetical protein